MKKLLIVVDMQTDFVTGALGTKEAQAIVPMGAEKIKKAKEDGTDVIFTLDTHEENYLDTQEGKQLPVPHCIKNTEGWMLVPQLRPLAGGCMSVEKPTFGSTRLAHIVGKAGYDEIELIGLCTDICVISNAMLVKASLPNVPIYINADLCAGVTPESHRTALDAMAACQMAIVHG